MLSELHFPLAGRFYDHVARLRLDTIQYTNRFNILVPTVINCVIYYTHCALLAAYDVHPYEE